MPTWIYVHRNKVGAVDTSFIVGYKSNLDVAKFAHGRISLLQNPSPCSERPYIATRGQKGALDMIEATPIIIC